MPSPVLTTAAELSARLARSEAEQAAGNYMEAATLLESVADAMPQDVSMARLAAGAWQLAGRRARARAVLTRTLAPLDLATLRMADHDLYELGALLLDVGAPADALRCFDQVRRARGDQGAILGAMASAHRALGHLDDAWTLAQRAVQADRKNATLLLTAAQVRHAQLAFDDALAWLKKAESARPGHAPIRMQRALTRLIAGVTRHGWADFESRGRPASPAGVREWRGESLTGQTMLVLADQGLGDLFHFLRFVPLLRDRGAERVLVEAPPSTHALLEASGFEPVLPGSATEATVSAPLLSLPHLLRTDTALLGERVPYLSAGAADAESAGLPESRFAVAAEGERSADSARENRKRLALVLAGNPDFLATELRDADPTVLPALLEWPDVEWHWMLPGVAPAVAHQRLIMPQVPPDWRSTARMLAQFDGVVSVDTAAAHLAGAMGLPAFVLLPYTPDWRWGAHAPTTGWYPSARLLRQDRPRDWSAALQALRAALDASEWTRKTG
jgi:tetratricopeptide (TPR) repeat protein